MYVICSESSPGIFKVWPILKVLLVKLLSFFISSTVVLYLLAIAYNVSPDFTVYVLVVVLVCEGIFKTWPILRVLLVKLFNDFILSTVVLYLFAIPYRVSPLFTVYVFVLVSSFSVGTFNICPTANESVVKLLIDFKLSTVVPYFWAIAYNVSPDFTIYSPVVTSVSLEGIYKFWPTLSKLLVKLFACFNSSTEIPNFLDILHRLSPDTIFM